MKTILIFLFVSTFLIASVCDNKHFSNEDIYFCLKDNIKEKQKEFKMKLNNNSIYQNKIRYIEAKSKYESAEYKCGTYQPIRYLEIKKEELEKELYFEKKN